MTLPLISKWIVGLLAGTLIIAATSPLFVRSYLPLEPDPVRGVWTLRPNQVYRWRSEGYANTFIGPMGMPGRYTIPNRDQPTLRVALWGDSQAEGVCVADPLKLHAQIEQACSSPTAVFPFARSGEDASVWLTQMPAVEASLGIDAHVMLIVDLPDLFAATSAPIAPPQADAVAQANSAIARRVPAFVIQAVRHLVTEADGQTPRRWRFTLGPAKPTTAVANAAVSRPSHDWSAPIEAICKATELPVFVVYAPHTPRITGGKVVSIDDAAADFRAFCSAAEASGLNVIDMSESLAEACGEGIWPRGFHNGYIGSGHLNENGYRLIASKVAAAITPIDGQANPSSDPISPGASPAVPGVGK